MCNLAGVGLFHSSYTCRNFCRLTPVACKAVVNFFTAHALKLSAVAQVCIYFPENDSYVLFSSRLCLIIFSDTNLSSSGS